MKLLKPRRELFLAGALAASTLGCEATEVAEPWPTSQVRSVEAELQGGQSDLDLPRENAVVYLGDITNLNGAFCSGTLITSTWALTARHCTNGSVGGGGTKPAAVTVTGPTNAVWVGNQHPQGQPFPIPRAIRTITQVVPFNSSVFAGFPAGSAPVYSELATDVALVKFSPPVTNAAIPTKPKFIRLPMAPPGVWLGNYMPGGMSGYGKELLPGNTTTTPPPFRKYYEIPSPGLYIYTYDLGSIAVLDNISPNGAPHHSVGGDSGGPLYRMGSPAGVRDVVGVVSGHGSDTDPCEYLGLCEDEQVTWWADITAPAVKQFIESVVDPDQDGRWEGEIDYPGQSNSYGGTCDVTNDPDCDLVTNLHDNCRYDWNPDQINSDSDLDGDVCDLCPSAIDARENCNYDAELVANNGARAYYTEAMAIAGPYPPPPDPIFKGDACDPVACMDMATAGGELPSSYGSPNPSSQLCLFDAVKVGGQCAFVSEVQIERDAKHDTPVTGDTSYRFCPCNNDRSRATDRVANCLAGQNPCSVQWSTFPLAQNSYQMTMDPNLPFIPGEPVRGTLSEVFNPVPKPDSSPLLWDFQHEYNLIPGATPVSFPLMEATIGDVALDGLVWASVRRVNGSAPLLSVQNLHQTWRPISVRVYAKVVGGSAMKWIAGVPWYRCWGPNCNNGLSKPWLWAVNPQAEGPDMIQLISQATSLPIDEMATPAAYNLLLSANGTTVNVVSAAEPSFILDAEETSAMPKLAVVDTSSFAVNGVIAHSGTDETQFSALSTTPYTPPVTGWATKPTNVTLSAIKQRLYAFGAPSSIYAFNWSPSAPSWTSYTIYGDVPVDPQALLYNWRDGLLYAADRSGLVRRVLRMTPHPTFPRRLISTVIWQGSSGSSGQTEYLGVDHLGRMVLTVAAESSYRVIVLENSDQCFAEGVRAVAARSASGVLLAAPVEDERAWYSALAGTAQAIDYQQDVAGSYLNATIDPCDTNWAFSQ